MFNKNKPVKVLINRDKCTKCGICTEVCSSYLKFGKDGFPCASENNESIMGCIQCGHCMMTCPNDAIEIIGEDIDNAHLRKILELPTYDSLNSLLQKRRSIRKYKDQEIPKDLIEKIVNSAATAAVSIPPSEVKVLVINNKEKVQKLAKEIVQELKSLKKIMNPLTLALLRLSTGETNYKIFKDFILPLCDEIVTKEAQGIDYLFYEAPAVMIFYGSELTDKEDILIAATTATMAAESLDLGTCYIGTLGAMLGKSKKLREKYGIGITDKIGTAFIVGYPDIKFRKGFQRKFKEVKIIE